jgi:glycosyltransferase involved in cell wall biosynthesis
MTLSGAPKVACGVFSQMPAGCELMTVAARPGPLEPEFQRLGETVVVARNERPTLASPLNAQVAYVADRAIAQPIRAAALARRIARWKPDIVYVNSAAALPLAARCAPPTARVIVHIHEIETLLSEHARLPVANMLLSRPSRYIAVSHAAEADLISRGIAADKITVIPPLYDETEYPAPAAPRTLPNGRPLHIGGIGTDFWRKGIVLWLLTAAELSRNLPPGAVKFTWLGITATEAGSQARVMARKLGLNGVIEFVPGGSGLSGKMREFDILAVTSWEESASIVAMEAMALGIPVACFAGSGGPPEIVGDAGVIVDGFSPAAMAAAIAQMTASDETYRNHSARSIDRARSRFASSVVVPQIWRVIDNVMNGSG